MTKEEAISAVRSEKTVDCTETAYHEEIRKALQDYAGKMVDQKQDIYAMIALEEVKRLDAKFNPF